MDSVKFGNDIAGASVVVAELDNGATYYVWVRAKNSVGTSAFSPAASGTPQAPVAPAAPARPVVTAGNGQLTVTWTPVVDATAYEVWHGESANSADAQQFGGDVAGAAATITGFDKYIKRYVWVKAKNSAGESGFSPSASGIPLGLDPRLVGVWQFILSGDILEECTITNTTATVDGVQSLGTMEFGGPGYGSGSGSSFSDTFSGDILWAEAFDDQDVLDQQMFFTPASGRWDVTSAGVIIIKYWPGHENSMWNSMSGRQPTGDYFGIYYMNLNDDGTQVAIFHTSDQSDGYGPTETSSLEAAKARFTIGDIKLWLSTAAGDPQAKVDPENALPRE
jgi:hypothetical protein